VATSSVRLKPAEPLSWFKTCNKLPQIVARAEADALGADEALMLNPEGWAVEGTASNLFWIQDGTVFTPPLSSGALPGITRAAILEICQRLTLRWQEASIKADHLPASEGVFLTLSSLGVVAASQLNNRPLGHSPIADRIRDAYSELLLSETQR
jgi:branched-subunit amino acid aminotransferase/4-amino-4-deoxychorismate lyase